MKTVRELLQDADPLQSESMSPAQYNFRRQAILEAASDVRVPAEVKSRPLVLVLAMLALVVIAASFLGGHVWPIFVGDVQAAVRFEVRLAEDRPAPGLRGAKVSGSDRSVYLHKEVIVDNSDIAAAQIVPDDGTSRYGVGLEFNASGAEKMRQATMNHIGKPVAILIDGQVVVAPTLRSVIGASAVVNGTYTRTQAERIVNGIGIP